jgi:hypothetical protein
LGRHGVERERIRDVEELEHVGAGAVGHGRPVPRDLVLEILAIGPGLIDLEADFGSGDPRAFRGLDESVDDRPRLAVVDLVDRRPEDVLSAVARGDDRRGDIEIEDQLGRGALVDVEPLDQLEAGLNAAGDLQLVGLVLGVEPIMSRICV